MIPRIPSPRAWDRRAKGDVNDEVLRSIGKRCYGNPQRTLQLMLVHIGRFQF